MLSAQLTKIRSTDLPTSCSLGVLNDFMRFSLVYAGRYDLCAGSEMGHGSTFARDFRPFGRTRTAAIVCQRILQSSAKDCVLTYSRLRRIFSGWIFSK